MRTLAPLGLLLAFCTGCSDSKPTAELISWHIDGPPASINGEDNAPKFVPIRVRVKATATALYRKNARGEYELKCEDFTVTGNGKKVEGVYFRGGATQEAIQSEALTDKPKGQKEVDVGFAVPVDFPARTDLVLNCNDLPPLPLDPAKKK